MKYKPKTLKKIQNIQLNAYRVIAKAIEDDEINSFYHIVSDEMLNIANADGITFYSVENNQLHFQLLKNRSLDINKGGISEKDIDLSLPEILDKHGKPNTKYASVYVAHTGKSMHIKDVYDKSVYEDKKFDFQGTINFDKNNNKFPS